MIYRILFILLLVSQQLVAQNTVSEVPGPFKSWANVKQRFGAVGDGKQDDTKAFQKALDNLTDYRFGVNTATATAYTVIYLPRGTYRITSALQLESKIGVSIIGEDPENTTIIWDGPSGGSALYCNGSSYFKIARIQWNARSNGSTGIAIRWRESKTGSDSYAPQMIEISECIFRSFAQGIGGGVFQEGERDATNSEVSIRNCHFYNCTDAGIAIGGYNALDYWIWNCRFIQCNIGVKNRFGNYHIYSSYFKKSAVADIHNHHGYYTSIRKCYSDSSKYFSMDDGFSCNFFIRVLEGNYVKNSIDFPVEYTDYGYVTLVDNFFFKNANSNWPFAVNIVGRNAICKEGPYKIFSYRNYYEYAKPLRINRSLYQQHDYTVGDYGYGQAKPAVKERAFIDSILLPFAKQATNVVFEVPQGATADMVQKMINTASSENYRGKRPVVHFSPGIYYMDKTLVIPANSDVQIKGDGFIYATRIYQAKTGFKGKYLFEIKGPSRATVSDLHLGTEGALSPNGILLSGIDQAASNVLVDQMVAPPEAHALVADNLQRTYVQKTNSYYAYNDSIAGGSKTATNVHLFGGQFGFANTSGQVVYLAKDCWFEWTKDTAAVFSITGPGKVILDGCRIASSSQASVPFVRTTGKFTGLLALMNVYTDNFINNSAAGAEHDLFVMNTSTQRMSGNPRLSKKEKSKVALLGVSVRQNENTEQDYQSQPGVPAFMSTVFSYSAGKLPLLYKYAVTKNTQFYSTRVSFGNMREAFRLSAK